MLDDIPICISRGFSCARGSLLPRVGSWDSRLEESAAFLVLWLFLCWMYRTRSFVKI